jgi:hypothetical protein
MFDTKVAILVLDDMEVWKKLNVTAFLATGIAASVTEAVGQPYVDAEGKRYTPLLGQPIMIYAASRSTLIRTRNQAQQRGLTCGAYVEAMFETGHDAANREVFAAEPADEPALVGIAVRGPIKEVDKAIKGAERHP